MDDRSTGSMLAYGGRVSLRGSFEGPIPQYTSQLLLHTMLDPKVSSACDFYTRE